MEFRVDVMNQLQAGELWGICCTDAAGMGLDLRDIKIIVQWGYTSSLCALMQRLGRGARDPLLTAVGIYLVEPIYFDSYKGKRKRPAVEEDSRQNKNKKGSNSRAGVENDSREEDVDSEFEGGDDGFRDHDGSWERGLTGGFTRRWLGLVAVIVSSIRNDCNPISSRAAHPR